MNYVIVFLLGMGSLYSASSSACDQGTSYAGTTSKGKACRAVVNQNMIAGTTWQTIMCVEAPNLDSASTDFAGKYYTYSAQGYEKTGFMNDYQYLDDTLKAVLPALEYQAGAACEKPYLAANNFNNLCYPRLKFAWHGDDEYIWYFVVSRISRDQKTTPLAVIYESAPKGLISKQKLDYCHITASSL